MADMTKINLLAEHLRSDVRKKANSKEISAEDASRARLRQSR